MKHFKRTGVAALMAGAGLIGLGVAHAADGPQYKISGFGTLAGTVTDKSDLEFRTSLGQSKGVNSMLDLGADSRFGLQGVVDFGQGLTVTAQVLSQRQRTDNTATSNRDFDLGIEWLNAQYAITPQLDVRMGRVVLPSFMFSESRNVGYSQPWLRVPLDVYIQMPMRTLDGVQAAWRIPVGGSVITIQPSFGKANFNVTATLGGVPVVVQSDNNRTDALNVTFESGDWQLRAGQVRGKTKDLTLDVAPGFMPAIVYDMKDTFTSAGVQYDNGTALVIAEYATRRQNDLPGFGQPAADTDHWYVAGGWRFGKWLPMAIYGKSKDNLAKTSTNSPALSVRYDLMTNVAVKAQWNRVAARDERAFVSNSSTDTRKVNVFAAGIDFVF